MKCQVVFIFAIAGMALVLAETSNEITKKAHDECQSDPATAVKDSVVAKSIKGTVDVDAIGPHTLCMNVKLGMQKENGDIDKDELRAGVKKLNQNDDAIVEKVVTECGKRDGNTAYKAAVALVECYLKYTTQRLAVPRKQKRK